MTVTDRAVTYGTLTKIFHWVTALLIFTIAPLGAVANRLPHDTNAEIALKAQLFSLHKTLGVIVFAVALARILWAVSQPKPGPLHPERKAETWLAETVHWVLYLSLVAVPLTGWIHHAATTGFAPLLLPFGQTLPFVPKDESIAKYFAGLHWLFSKIMIVAILFHIAGALKHHLLDKDATLRRMWFGRTDAGQAAKHTGTLVAPLAAVAVYLVAVGGGAAAGIYTQDTSNTSPRLAAVSSEWTVTEGQIALTITQLGNPVAGNFADWTSAIRFDPSAEGTLGSVTTTIAVTSLQIGSVTRDALGTDFFDAANFPMAVFTGDIVADGSNYLADGVLTIKDITVPLSLPFTLTLDGDTANMAGNLRIDRRDFNIGNTVTDESSLGFGVDVDITLTATRTAE